MEDSDIRKMTVFERLQAMESLWNTLVYENPDIDSPEWHKDILSARKSKIESGEARFISLEKLKEYYKQ
jgi:hypothetical protein